MRVVALVLVVFAMAATAVGCGDGDDGDAGGSGAGSGGDELRGRTFLSTDVDGRDLVAGTELRISFNEDGTLSASAGCNQFVGELAIEDGALVVTNLGGTEMGCDPERHAQDDWFTAVLSGRPSYDVSDDGGLTLTAGDVSIDFLDREVADPDLPLIGTRWVVDTILEGSGPDGSASSVPEGAEAWVTFGADGKVSGHDGCNGFGGTYEERDQKVVITERVQTLIGCPGLDRLTLAVAAATNGEVGYRIQAKRLTLTGAEGRGVSAVGGSA